MPHRSSSWGYRSRVRSTSTSTSTGPSPTTRAGETKAVAQPGGQVRTRRRTDRGWTRQDCRRDRVHGTTDPGCAARLRLLLLDPPRQLVPVKRKPWRSRAARYGLDDGPIGDGRTGLQVQGAQYVYVYFYSTPPPRRQLVPGRRKPWRSRAARYGLDDGPTGGGRARHAA
jgi:hypothetical protein